MKTPPSQQLSLLTAAAELRAGGASWATVGEKVGRSPETCRQWVRRYADAWSRLYREAERQLIAEAGAEARTSLRQMLRGKELRFVLAAAQFLLRSRNTQRLRDEQADRPDPTLTVGEFVAFAKYLKGLTDAQLTAHLDDFLAQRRAAAAGADPGAADPASPDQPQ